MILFRSVCLPVAALIGLSAQGGAAATTAPAVEWQAEYFRAAEEAQAQGRMLLVRFVDAANPQAEAAFEKESLADPQVAARLAGYTCVRVALDGTIEIDGQSIELVKHPAFAEMLGRPGLAIVDYFSAGATHYGHVVSAFPRSNGRPMTAAEVRTALELPRGSLTQRTMIYAVRIHPERPASTTGEFNPVLAQEAASHSRYQAAIRNQGHHNWGGRFSRILGRLRGAGDAREVVAESWPGQSLVDACVECVDSWRHSSGHWQAVSSRHSSFGYDIRRGANGIWYATGIFAERG